ncbi:MAG: type II secretion system F family protein [Patescibacteria group bacterium]|nr:type II secretion system F family protein [Patescibacteria group bacterium]
MDFSYKARNTQGGIQTGIVKASDESSALEILKKNNLDVFYIEPAAAENWTAKLAHMFSKVSAKDKVVFSRQLSILIESNVPIIRALKTLSDQTASPALGDICRQMANSVEEGNALSESLEKHPKIFDRFYVSIVKTGETSGDLKRSLNYLADHLEKEYELKRKIKAAMMYPVIILTAFTGIFLFLTIKVLPQLTDILKDSGVKLPWTTKIIIATSDFMSTHWLLVVVLLFGVVGGLVAAVRTESGKAHFDAIILKIPIIGQVIQFAYIARFAENLKVLLEEGISIVKALGVLAEVMDNKIYQDIIIRIQKNVEKGKSMADAMVGDERAFPRMVPQMIKVGEESGRTAEVLGNIERFYTREVNNMTENLTTIIEPILIIILGGGTGILVAAIIMPIYDMAGAL